MMIINGDSAEVLKELKPESVDLIVTSPPYDSLRSYDGCKWDFDVFKKVADGCARVICGGGGNSLDCKRCDRERERNGDIIQTGVIF